MRTLAPDITLRRAKPEDAEAIERIRVSAWKLAYRNFMPEAFLNALKPTNNLGELRRRLSQQSKDFTVFVAEHPQNIVAFAIAGKPRYKTNIGAMELWALNVTPDYWRAGIGSALVERVSLYAAEIGFERLELWCLKGNRSAQEAYRKLGFVESGQDRSSSQLTGHVLHESHYVKLL